MNNNVNEKAVENAVKTLNKSVDNAVESARMSGELSAENEKFIKLFDDKSFVEKFVAADDSAKAKELCAENGVDISEEEINEIKAASKKLEKKIMSASDELDDDALESVSGGSSWNVFNMINPGVAGNNSSSVCEAVAIKATVVCTLPSVFKGTSAPLPGGIKYL